MRLQQEDMTEVKTPAAENNKIFLGKPDKGMTTPVTDPVPSQLRRCNLWSKVKGLIRMLLWDRYGSTSPLPRVSWTCTMHNYESTHFLLTSAAAAIFNIRHSEKGNQPLNCRHAKYQILRRLDHPANCRGEAWVSKWWEQLPHLTSNVELKPDNPMSMSPH